MEEVKILGLVGTDSLRVFTLDEITHAINTMSYPHHEAHEGRRFYRVYSVASLGAMTTPDDLISLTWTTPDTARWEHFTFLAGGTGGWEFKLIEAPTGGAITPTGKLPMINRNRNSANVSGAIALDSTPGEISYDATKATGGTELWGQHIAGDMKVAGHVSGDRDEIIMAQNTKYQLYLEGSDLDPGWIYVDWYEHENKL